MVSSFRSFVHYFREHPLRGVLTFATIAVGVGVLIISLSLSMDVTAALNRQLTESGHRIVIANGSFADDGSLSRQMPPVFDADVAQTLALEMDTLSNIGSVGAGRLRADRFEAQNRTYQARSIVSADTAYAEWAGLQMIAGVFYTEEDVASRAQVVVIVESAARRIFGSAEDAIGGQLLFAQPQISTDGAGGFRARQVQAAYTVLGVFTDPSELERTAFGIGDIVVPTSAGMPVGLQIAFDPSAVIVATVRGESVAQAQARITEILTAEYGQDTEVAVWEGSPGGPATLIDQSRRTVHRFTLAINALGAVLLLAGSLGIFSIMLVEVLNRTREIGLRRALGATQAGIRRFFMGQAFITASTGGLIGIGLALLFYRPVAESLAPFFQSAGLSVAQLGLDLPGVLPIIGALAVAIVFGVVFGFFPALSASRAPIVECIREDAA